MTAFGPLRVGVIGHGTIGRVVVAALAAGDIPGAVCAGFMRRGPAGAGDQRRMGSIEQLVESSDVVVEAAGQHALRSLGPKVLATGTDLLAVSVGALADERVHDELCVPGGGRLLLSTGAIGGVDVLRAAMRCGALDHVELVSRKEAAALERPWMDGATLDRLRTCGRQFELFEGTAREAARRFPATANVAVTLALATVGLDETRVRVLASPVEGSTHVIRARGPSGEYGLDLANSTAPGNPRTSAVTPFAVLRALEDLSARCVLV